MSRRRRASQPVEIRITAEQFAWNIHYPGPDRVFGRTSQALISASNPVGIDREDPAAADDIGVLNVLMLPVESHGGDSADQPRRDSQLHAERDAREAGRHPGMTSRVWFTPITTGDWEIACSQLCGLGHYRMRGEYHVVDQAAWDRWQATNCRLR